MGSPAREQEEARGIAPEVVPGRARRRRIAEGGGDLRGPAAFEEIGAEGLVLTLSWGGGFEEETAELA
jgi:hypothetical protein